MSSPRKAPRAKSKRVSPSLRGTRKREPGGRRRAKPRKHRAPGSGSPDRPGLAAGISVSAQAKRLAADIERGLAQGEADALAPDALQDLLAALCRTYSAQVEGGRDFLPVRSRTSLNGTEVMTTASGLLKAANLAVFELGMWQSWTGR